MIVFIILIFVFENEFEMLLDQLIHRKQLQQAQFKIKVKYPKYKQLQEVMIVGKWKFFYRERGKISVGAVSQKIESYFCRMLIIVGG